MQETMQFLCENVQGCVLGYTQSDEITLVLCDWQNLDTCAWFDNEVQKIVSISASMATLAFNKALDEMLINVNNSAFEFRPSMTEWATSVLKRFSSKQWKAMFDSRAFNLPKEEVCNCLIWRQQDATRNSILSLGQSLYSQKQMDGIKCDALQDKMFVEKGVNWNNLDTTLKRGSCCVKNDDGEWIVDNEIPKFTEDREYVEKRLKFENIG